MPDAPPTDPRLAGVAGALRARLARSCAHLPPSEFDGLLHAMATTQLRWADREREHG